MAVFNDVSLSPYTGLVGSAITFLGSAVRRGDLSWVDEIDFLTHLLRHIPGQLLVIWDGSPIHRCQAVKDFLAEGGARRIHLVGFDFEQ